MSEVSVYKAKGIEIWLEVTEDHTELKSSGPLSLPCAPIIRHVNSMLQNEKPIEVKDDSVVLTTWLPPIPSGPFRRALKAEIDILLRRKYVPQAVSINAFKRCSCRCAHCNMVQSPSEELTTGELKDFIDQVIDLGAISIGFAEGDPLLREDLTELVEHVDREKAIASVFTPGILLTEEKAAELKRAGLYAVIIGLRSPIPAEHDKARGVKGGFEKATQSMKNAVKAGLYVSMHTHANPDLIESGKLEGLYDLAAQLGVHELTVWEGIPTWGYMGNEGMMLNESHRKRILDMYRRVNSTQEGPRMFSMTFFESPNLFGCMAGRRWLNLVDSGDLTPCTYVPISFGNIREESVKDIWGRMRKFPEFRRKRSCLMLDPEFRSKYFKEIPKLPIHMGKLD
ncbi:MAG: radical SAM protein [Methanocellales archaeon]|nr:radical SAM protein [Methanocellales archaeon]MDD5447327.1 radical SAM protein [Methanocellales archaeon]